MKSMRKQNILINSWMELTLTTSIKAIVLHWGRGGRGGEGGGGEGERGRGGRGRGGEGERGDRGEGGGVIVLVINN